MYRSRILGRNLDISLQSFAPCYSQVTSTALPWDLQYISSNSRNLLRISTVQLLYTVKEKGAKPDRKPFKKSIQEPQVWELFRLCPETSTKLDVHEFGFNTNVQTSQHVDSCPCPFDSERRPSPHVTEWLILGPNRVQSSSQIHSPWLKRKCWLRHKHRATIEPPPSY